MAWSGAAAPQDPRLRQVPGLQLFLLPGPLLLDVLHAPSTASSGRNATTTSSGLRYGLFCRVESSFLLWFIRAPS